MRIENAPQNLCWVLPLVIIQSDKRNMVYYGGQRERMESIYAFKVQGVLQHRA